MKIAVTATGDTLDSAVDPRFGRAARFIVYESDSGEFQVSGNSAGVQSTQGAGIQAADELGRLGVQCLITGHCGPKAFRALQAAGIRIFTGAQGTVAETLERFRRGEMSEATTPDVAGRWA